jgi:hypothetical protein
MLSAANTSNSNASQTLPCSLLPSSLLPAAIQPCRTAGPAIQRNLNDPASPDRTVPDMQDRREAFY